MIYTIVANDKVLRYPSLELLKKMHGNGAAYQSFSDEELAEVSKKTRGAKLYAHKGGAVLADTEGHIAVIKAIEEIDSVQKRLDGIDRKHGQRAARSLALKAARAAKIGEDDDDLKRLGEAERQAEALRRRMGSLKEIIGV
jgi:hypothetical protein